MNLKKILMLVAGTVLVVPTTLSVVACNDPIQSKHIDSVITKTNLQEITVSSGSTKPSTQQVLTAINAINNITLSTKDVEITVKDSKNATVKGLGNYDGTINVRFTTNVQKNIDKVIQTKDLDVITIPSSSTKPSEQQVLTAINAINNITLSTKDVEITVKDSKNATVKGLGDYDGTINVNFTTNVQKNIDSIITKNDLHEIIVPSSDHSDKPSSSEVLTAIDTVNHTTLSTKDIKINVIDDQNATVKGIGDYDGTINVSFTTNVKTNIATAVTKTNLQEIIVPSSDESDKPSVDQVLAAINKINDITLSSKDVKIIVKDDSNATITGIGNYDSSTTVIFRTTVKINIDSFIKIKDLGPVTSSNPGTFPTRKQLLEVVNKLNNSNLIEDKDVNLNLEVFPLTKKGYLFIEGIGNYTGTTKLNFTLIS